MAISSSSSSSIVTDLCLKAVVTALLASSIVSLPLVLTYNDFYVSIFPEAYYDKIAQDYWNSSNWPSPVGLTLGILAVIVGQIFTLIYFHFWNQGYIAIPRNSIQKIGAPKYNYNEALIEHISQPEGFVMLGGYLIFTWMFGLMPKSYYSFSGGINWTHVIAQLLVQDFIQYCMHLIEHNAHPNFYQKSHKPHHRFTNPKMFDAFNGSPADTACMILIPLIITARIVPANVWSYMAFGSLYANWLVLIHAEYSHPWDPLFLMIGFGTSADHHVHHKLFNYNFGHLFMYWDKICGTYRSPTNVSLFTLNTSSKYS